MWIAERAESVRRRVRARRSDSRLRRFAVARPGVAGVMERVVQDGLTYLTVDALIDLAEAVERLETAGVDGAIIECGTALGGSAIVLAACKSPGRPMHVYDAFGVIPPPSDVDGERVLARYEEIVGGQSEGISGGTYYGYHDDLFGEVTATFERFGFGLATNNIEMHKGLYEDTLDVQFPVALAHLDCDWFESVTTCLRAVGGKLVAEGRIVVDDYHCWDGCTLAVDDFLEAPENRGFYDRVELSRLHLVKR